MKPTTKILSVLIATQIAFSCFALAVESAKTTAVKASVSANKTTGKTLTKKKLITKKKTSAKSKKSVSTKKTVTTPVSAASTEPKEAIETELDTIDKMEAAAAADAAATAKIAQATAAANITKASTTSPTATSTAAAVAPVETSWLKPSVSVGASYNMAAEAPKEGEQNRYMEYEVIPALVTGPIKTLLWFKYDQSLIDNSQSEWQDFPIVFSTAKPFNAGDYITLSPAIAITIPQSKETKNNIQLNYSTNANVTIGLNTKTLGWDGVVLNLQTGYTKMTNEFTTSAKGEPIVSYRLRQRINFWYPIVGTLSFKSRFEFNSTFSYKNVVKNNFLHFVALDYGFMDKYSVNFGTTNAGPTMSGPNYENNLKFYSDASSEFFLGVGADF